MIDVTLVDTLTGIRIECSGSEAALFVSHLLFPEEHLLREIFSVVH